MICSVYRPGDGRTKKKSCAASFDIEKHLILDIFSAKRAAEFRKGRSIEIEFVSVSCAKLVNFCSNTNMALLTDLGVKMPRRGPIHFGECNKETWAGRKPIHAHHAIGAVAKLVRARFRTIALSTAME